MRKEDLDAYFNDLIAARLTDCLSVAVAYKGETAYAFCGAYLGSEFLLSCGRNESGCRCNSSVRRDQ